MNIMKNFHKFIKCNGKIHYFLALILFCSVWMDIYLRVYTVCQGTFYLLIKDNVFLKYFFNRLLSGVHDFRFKIDQGVNESELIAKIDRLNFKWWYVIRRGDNGYLLQQPLVHSWKRCR